MQINPQNVFNPFVAGPGFVVTISPGSMLIAGVTTTIPPTVAVVTSGATSYIYLSLATGLVTVNTTGFPALNAYPIATVVASTLGISSLIDSRPDIFGGGGGGGSSESVQTASSNSNIGFGGTSNTLIQATAGAGITLTLPTAIGLSGQIVRVVQVDAGSGGVTLATTGGQTISGRSTYKLTNQWQAVILESSNANWIVTATAG